MATRMQNDDASQIHDMLLSAKRGEWDVVFDILEDKPYLVNCISSDRAWGVLHQAAWMNNFPSLYSIFSEFQDAIQLFKRNKHVNTARVNLHVTYPLTVVYSVTCLKQREDSRVELKCCLRQLVFS